LGAAIISTIVDTDLANNLRERGLKRAARFSWAQTARETLQIYQLAAY
jgi:glycosyltransferase involved in cell wall biosynthesis